jgi:dihydrofolate synthase/folylpolyglutamate synthase
VRAAAASTLVPGRFEVVDTRRTPCSTAPTTRRDGGAGRGAARRSSAAGAGRVVSILDDKDAAGMLRELLPLCDEVVCTASANPRALPPATLAVAVRPARRAAGATVARPAPALARRARARARTASRWPPARSTSSPTCCARGAGAGATL